MSSFIPVKYDDYNSNQKTSSNTDKIQGKSFSSANFLESNTLEIIENIKRSVISDKDIYLRRIFPSLNLVEFFKELTQNLSDFSYTYELKLKIGSLEDLYQIVDFNKIYGYLQNKPKIIDILEKIPIELLKYFLDDDILTLEIISDPEEVDSEYIQIKVITKSDLEDTFERLGNFEKDWYFKNVDFLSVNLIFDIGYR